jgi:hypothetical protein
MAGSFSLTSPGFVRSKYATSSIVCRDTGVGIDPLPNVAVIRVDERTGPFPATAQLTYILDDNLAASMGWPSQVEQIWPIDAQDSPYVIENDDKIIIYTVSTKGAKTCIFTGFAQIPQVDLTSESQALTFAAVGQEAREWDTPFRGSIQRNADNPYNDPAVGVVQPALTTDLPARMNPSDTTLADGNKGGITGNSTPPNFDELQGDPTISYPIFLASYVQPSQGGVPNLQSVPASQRLFTLSSASRYVMGVGNAAETYVQNADFSQLATLLQSYAPPTGSTISNLDGDTTADITVRDYDLSDKAWPDALSELLSYGGFAFSFVTTTDDDGDPIKTINIYRNDALTRVAPKKVYLQPVGSSSRSNATSFHLARDSNAIINSYSIESPLKQVECSFLLAPLYTPNAADIAVGPAGRGQYIKSSWTPTTTGDIRHRYRWYGMDELGEGHWNTQLAKFQKIAFDFASTSFVPAALFPPDSDDNPRYVKRYRPGQTSLISLDSNGSPLKAELAISFNYAAIPPNIYNGTIAGDWFTVNGGWRLLPDRLGIEVDIDDPEAWDPGKGPDDKILGISYWANPSGAGVIKASWGGKPTNPSISPVLRLTTVIDDDRMLSARAIYRGTASPTQFARHRRVDCRDHFQFNRIFQGSKYNTGAADVIARDDTPLAISHASALRGKTEFPPVAGSITIPHITSFYQLGDRISEIDGRNINLQMNVGSSGGEAKNYPFVVARSWTFQPNQSTTLQLSDHRAEGVNL